MTFGEKIKEARKQLGLSQEKFAAKMGVSFSTINRWEKGHFLPSYLAQAQFETFCKENGIVFEADSGANQ
ncbi:MAG: helix-turn-helix transcriptional regulator [Clostridiales bacterium]|nr:helix-turn-helix transcriptional regulator [Clostridiales bacterium]